MAKNANASLTPFPAPSWLGALAVIGAAVTWAS